MQSKLRFKIGAVEFEYEGPTEFTHESIKDLFSHMENLFRESNAHFAATPPAISTTMNVDEDYQPASKAIMISDLSTRSIAAKLGAKTGPEILLAAAARIKLISGKSTFSRTELLSEIKSASGYYNKNMSSNLTKMIKTLLEAHRLHESSNDRYSLSAAEATSLEAKLA